MSSRVLQALILGFVLGLGLAEFFNLPVTWLLLVWLSVVSSLFFLDKRAVPWALALATFLGGIFYFQSFQDSWHRKSTELFKFGHFTGRIISFPEPRDEKLFFKFETLQVEQQGKRQDYKARFMVITSRQSPVALGDRLKLIGGVQQSGDEHFLAKESVVALMNFPEIEILSSASPPDLAYWLKFVHDQLKTTVEAVLPAPASEFLLALLIGGSYRLPFNLRQAFVQTGTQHIMAVSGFNTAIIAFAILTFARRFSRNLAIGLTLLTLLFFVLLTGATPSVVRAALMTSTYLVGLLLGRPQNSTNILLLAALFMLLLNPWLLRYDLGFQLSFLSTYGLMVLLPRLSFLTRLLPLLADAALPGLVAFIMTWPVLALTTGRFSVIAVLANAFITPLIPLTMLVGFLTIILGWLHRQTALALLPLAWGLLNLMLSLVYYFSKMPITLVYLQLPVSVGAVYYILLFVFLRFSFKRPCASRSSLSF